MRRTAALACQATVMLVATTAVTPAGAQSNVTGQWSVLPYTMPINPIHVGLMRTGKILVVSGSSNDPTVTTNTAAVYDPNAGAINVQTVPWDLFCNGLSWMPDGRALIAGGTLQYPVNGHGWGGLKTTTVFDPVTEKFIQVQDMARGRWYPSIVGLADGRMATFSLARAGRHQQRRRDLYESQRLEPGILRAVHPGALSVAAPSPRRTRVHVGRERGLEHLQPVDEHV